MEAVSPADVEQAVVDELTALGYSASTRMLDLDAFLRVTSSGGSPLSLVADEFVVTLESFGKSEVAARDALALAVGKLEARARYTGALGSETCHGFRLVGDLANLPMPTQPTRRRYVTTAAARLRRRVTTF